MKVVIINEGNNLKKVAFFVVLLHDNIGPIPIRIIINKSKGPAVLSKYGAETLISVPFNSIETTGNMTPHKIINDVITRSILFNKNEASLDKYDSILILFLVKFW